MKTIMIAALLAVIFIGLLSIPAKQSTPAQQTPKIDLNVGFTVTSLQILRGRDSKVSDGPTWVFTAVSDREIIHGESVNYMTTGYVLCPWFDTVLKSENGRDCADGVERGAMWSDTGFIAEITSREAR